MATITLTKTIAKTATPLSMAGTERNDLRLDDATGKIEQLDYLSDLTTPCEHGGVLAWRTVGTISAGATAERLAAGLESKGWARV